MKNNAADITPTNKTKRWSLDNSIVLSQITTFVGALLVLVLFIFIPQAKPVLTPLISNYVIENFHYLLLTVYIGGSFGLLLFYQLLLLLNNIQKKSVFIDENIRYLRRISWLCMIGGIIGLLSSLYWIIWFPLSLMAFFIFLLVRVIKNIMQQAMIIKTENDYTV